MSDTKISEIEYLVAVIGSEAIRNQTRSNLLFNLVYDEKGKVEIPKEYVDEMIYLCQRKSNELEGRCEEGEQGALLTYAARVAKHAGRTEQAQLLYGAAITFNYEKNFTLTAAKIAVEAGMKDSAKKIYEKIISSYEEEEDFATAAELAEEAEMPERAQTYRKLEERLRHIPTHLKI